MTVDPHAGKPSRAVSRSHLLFLLGGLPDEVREPTPRAISTRRASPRRSRPARSTPARCTRRSCRRGRATARSAAWRSSRWACRPRTPTNPELIDFTRRLWVAAPLALALLVIDMGAHVFGIDLLPFLSPRAQQWLKLALAIPAVLWCGWPFFERGFASIRSGWLNMFTLIALGTGAAFLYSVVATVAPGPVPGRDARRSRPRPDLFRGGRGHRRARAARPGARAPRARADRRRDSRTARPRAQDRAPRALAAARPRPCRSPQSRSATSCACGPATRSRSTAP